MPLKNFSNIGELQEYEFITGEIVSLDYENDTCEIIIEGDTKTGVPIFYHCNPSAQERSNGAVQGGAFGFAKKDKVVVMRQQKPPNNMFVIGHKSGARPCKPLFVIFSSESGAEAVVWDILNDVLVRDIDSLSNTQTVLSDWGVNTRTECLEQDLREYLKDSEIQIGSNWYYQTERVAGLPPFNVDTPSLDIPWTIPPADSGQFISHEILDYLDFSGGTHTITNNDPLFDLHSQPFFINPITTKDQTPIPGMWVLAHGGDIIVDYWDTAEWGVCPLPNEQLYFSDGTRRFKIEQEYLFHRSIFDNKLDEGQQVIAPPTDELTLANSFLTSECLYILTRDAPYYILSDVDQSSVEEAYGSTKYNYLVYLEQITTGTHPEPEENLNPPYFHNTFTLPPIVSMKTGMATHGNTDKEKISLLFEFSFVYCDEYDYVLKNKTWTTSMLQQAKQILRIYFRYPFFKKNVDAVLFRRVNKERENLSLEPLESNLNLYNAAQVLSNDMANRQSLDPAHIGSDGSETQDRTQEAYYGLYTFPHDQRLWGVGENVIVGNFGLQRQLERAVDNSDIQIPKSYTVVRTGQVKQIADGDWQITHDENGQQQVTQGQGWKQSSGHYDNIIFQDFTEAGLATQRGKDNEIYTTQVFGVIGNPNNYQNQIDQHWAGFATFDSTELLKYVVENFRCDQDKYRRPRIFLCTIT